MIGDARIVALSEGVHGGAEPLEFRNRLFKYLVNDLGFNAVVIESGVVETRVVDDYVTGGPGDLDAVVKRGLSWGFDTLQPNFELISWIRTHNAQLPAGASKVQFLGFDVPGSPGNPFVLRGPDTALDAALEYLRKVDPQSAAQIDRRLAALLPALKSTIGYAKVEQAQRDSFTAAIADLVSLLDRHQFDYTAKSSESDYEWGERAAVGAQPIDAFFRRMPVGWKLADGFDWEAEAELARNRAMESNLEWALNRLGPRSRVLIYAAVEHIASTPIQYPEEHQPDEFPLGAYAKAHFGENYVNILNVATGGEIKNCPMSENNLQVLKPPPATSIEALFASVHVSRYVLDLRNSPSPVSAWLHQVQDHWNGFGGMEFAPAAAFDIAFYVSPLTPACAPQ